MDLRIEEHQPCLSKQTNPNTFYFFVQKPKSLMGLH